MKSFRLSNILTVILFYTIIIYLLGCGATKTIQVKIGNTRGNIINEGLAAESGDWIYYKKELPNHELYKVHKNGTQNELILKGDVYFLNIINDWIYFIQRDDKNAIYKVREDGSEKTLITLDRSYNLSVADNWIYYIN